MAWMNSWDYCDIIASDSLVWTISLGFLKFWFYIVITLKLNVRYSIAICKALLISWNKLNHRVSWGYKWWHRDQLDTIDYGRCMCFILDWNHMHQLRINVDFKLHVRGILAYVFGFSGSCSKWFMKPEYRFYRSMGLNA